MLKKISPLISPELLKILAEMGHGDVIAFGDANFPAESSKALQVVPGDDYVPEVVEEYKKILAKHDVGEDKIEYLERFDFYSHTDTAYCVVATGETARYANITLKKGVIG